MCGPISPQGSAQVISTSLSNSITITKNRFVSYSQCSG